MINKLKLNKNRGITLIALVITIIVLLILAGVVISMLTGDNGILKQAVNAKEETEKAQIIEQIRLAENAARMGDNNGNITEEGLRRELDHYLKDEYNITEVKNGETLKGWNVSSKKVDGIEEFIEGNTVSEKKGITAADMYATQVNYYGKNVDYGIDIDGDGKTADDWEIFYIEDYNGEEDANSNMKNKLENGKRIFLIASDYVGQCCSELTTAIGKSNMHQQNSNIDDCSYLWSSSSLPSYSCITPKNADNKDACTFPSLFKFKKYDIESNKDKINSQCAASLLCTENWSSFAKEGIAEYAIGEPTVEMWCASWNNYYNNLENDKKELFREVHENEKGTNGYYIGDSKSQTSTYFYKVTSNDKYFTDDEGTEAKNAVSKLYFPHPGVSKESFDLDNDGKMENSIGYWLASPSAQSDSNVAAVRYWGTVSRIEYRNWRN